MAAQNEGKVVNAFILLLTLITVHFVLLFNCEKEFIYLSDFGILLGIWRPYKDLLEIVERAVYRKRPEYQHDLEVALKKFKPDFLTLLQNPVSISCIGSYYDVTLMRFII